MVALIFKILYY